MAKILFKSNLAPSVYEFLVDAPLIAHKCQPGQFVMIRTDEDSERIPLTIADFDREKGTITLIVQAVGNTTKHLCETFEEGDDILELLKKATIFSMLSARSAIRPKWAGLARLSA